MMRLAMALVGALALAGCATSKERVTLLDPAGTPNVQGSEMGSIVIEHDGGETVVDMANQQALLRGEGRKPRIRQLSERDAFHSEVMNDLPRAENPVQLQFPEGVSRLSAQQIEGLNRWLREDEAAGPRPGRQIIVQAYADSFGSEDDNWNLSWSRARNVAAQLREANLEIDDEDIVGMGEYDARKKNGDEVRDPQFRRVDIIIR